MCTGLGSGKSGSLETWMLVLGSGAGCMEQEISYLCTGEFKHTEKCPWA